MAGSPRGAHAPGCRERTETMPHYATTAPDYYPALRTTDLVAK
jgi:hypothetical protein